MTFINLNREFEPKKKDWNIVKKVEGIEVRLKEFKRQITNISRRQIPTTKKFKRRIRKLNEQYGVFSDDELETFTEWLTILKYSKSEYELNNRLKDYTEEDIAMFCSPERRAYLDKLNVVNRLEGR